MDLGLLALYVGPDQVMPVMSILATIAGFFLIFWNKVMGLVRRVLGKGRPSGTPAVNVTVNSGVNLKVEGGSSPPSPAAEPPKQP